MDVWAEVAAGARRLSEPTEELANVIKLFFFRILTNLQNKPECLSLASFSSQV
jgi:hypothetical protein